MDKRYSVLVEGSFIGVTCRMTGAAKGTVISLLVAIGKACSEYQDIVLRGLPCKNIQCDKSKYQN